MTFSKKPYISIIIPVYNRAHLIQRALNSILAQTYNNFEVIIVDDGSTDKLENIIKCHSDLRIRLVKHLNNRGAGAARNTGIKLSQGKLIAFLDSDDEWLPTKLEEQLTHFNTEKASNKKLKGSFTWFYLHRQDGNVEVRKFKKVKQWKKYFLSGCSISPGSTLLVDKTAYESVGLYDELLSRLEDWDWLIRFSAQFDLISYEKPLSHIYREETPSSLVVSSSLQRVTQKYWKGLSLSEKRIFFSAVKLELSYGYLKQNFLKACFYFFLAVIINPLFVTRGLSFFIKK